MHEKHYISPYRMMRGQATVAASVANFSVASLYHSGAARFALVVRDVTISAGAAGAIAGGFVQGAIGAISPTIAPMVTGEAALPGAVYTATPAALPGTAIIASAVAPGSPFEWLHDYPFAVLLPGWSLWFAPTVVNQAITISLVWELAYAANLEPPRDFAEYAEILAEIEKRGE